MKRKRQWTIVILTSVFAFSTVAEAVSTRRIDAVRQKALLNKEVLEKADFEVIDAFWEEALAELLFEENLSQIVSIRSQIFARRDGAESSQYSVAFISSAKKQLTAAFDQVQNWEPDQRKTWFERNLIILTAQLESGELLDLGMRIIGHENGTVRYWAVKALTNFSIVTKLNSPDFSDTELAARIIGQLETTANKETHPEILNLIATFAGQVNGPLAKQLLINIVDLRTSAYENWTVKYELMDAKLLRSLGNEILSQASRQNKAANSRRFAQLYSYAMQRFILGANVLSDVSKQQLASVLVEVEKPVLDRLLGSKSSIKTIVEKILTRKTAEQKNYSALEAEHDSLLGTATRKGDLPAALNFDYGKNPDGSAITAPKKLGPPPPVQPETETIESKADVAEPEAEAAEPETEAAETSG